MYTTRMFVYHELEHSDSDLPVLEPQLLLSSRRTLIDDFSAAHRRQRALISRQQYTDLSKTPLDAFNGSIGTE